MSVVDEIDDVQFLESCLAQANGFLAELPLELVIDRISWEAHKKDLERRIGELKSCQN
jgi:hypothetical protein